MVISKFIDMKGKFVQPVFNEFKQALNNHDLKTARRLRQDVHAIVRKKPILPPYDRAADMLYNLKEGNEIDAIIEARFLAKLPELNSDIVQSVIDTFSDLNYSEELIDYLNLVHSKYPQDIPTIESYFSQLFLHRRYNQCQIVAMELYRLKKSTQNQLYAAVASFMKAKSMEESITKFESSDFNSELPSNLKTQRTLYYTMAIKLVTQSGDDCIDGNRLIVESQIALEQFDEALSTLESKLDTVFSKDMITYFRLKMHALYKKFVKTKDESISQIIAETAIKFIETISIDSIDEWRLIVEFHPNPNEIIAKYINKSRGAFLAKIEYSLKQIQLSNGNPEKVNDFIQFVLEYSNKYSNRPFVLDDLLPYLKFEYSPTISRSAETFSLKPVIITFSNVVNAEIKRQLFDTLKSTNDFILRSSVCQTFSKEILELHNSKSVTLFMEFMLKQYSNNDNNLNYLIQAISMFFKMNSTGDSENTETQSNSSEKGSINDLNKQFDFFNKQPQLSPECISLLLRCIGLFGGSTFQQDLFLHSLKVDSIQFLSLAPLIVPDLIKSWDLPNLQSYLQHVAEFIRISLSIYMKNYAIIPSFNRKNFFCTFDSPSLKHDIEMNEVAYLFQLLEFLLKGACSIVKPNENKEKDIQNSGICLLNTNLSGSLYLNEFNHKKVAPPQKEILKQYYGKYDTSIVPLYYDDEKLRQTIYPSFLTENPIQKVVFELDAVMNLIFTMKFEKDRKQVSKSSKSEVEFMVNIIQNQLNDPIWNVIWEFAKSGNLDQYDQLINLHFDLVQMLSLVGICIVSRKAAKEKVINIVKNEAEKVIAGMRGKIEFKLNPELFNDEILSVQEAQKWKDEIGNKILENQIEVVTATMNTLLKSLNQP